MSTMADNPVTKRPGSCDLRSLIESIKLFDFVWLVTADF
jgi:hypothetical protein